MDGTWISNSIIGHVSNYFDIFIINLFYLLHLHLQVSI